MLDLPPRKPLEHAHSPKIEALRQAYAQNPASLETFWEELVQSGAPLVEEIPEHPTWRIVTFFWRDDGTTQQVLALISTITDRYRFNYTDAFLQRMADSDLWYVSYYLRADLRTSYQFVPIGAGQDPLPDGVKKREDWLDVLLKGVPDPFNAQQFPSRRGGEPSSILELPAAIPQTWWQARPDNPQGQIAEYQVPSTILETERRVWVYKPPHYTPENEPYSVLVMFDGMAWLMLASLQNTLDNLIAAGKIPPMLAILLDSPPTQRGQDLSCDAKFTAFLADELLTWAGTTLNASPDPAKTFIAGQSLGGLAAAFAGFSYPQRFGNIITQSGSFWWPETPHFSEQDEWLSAQLAASEKLPLRFYVSVGLQEWTLTLPNRHLRDVLVAKGYPVLFHEHNGGHEYLCWRGDIADALIALHQDWPTPYIADNPPLPRENPTFYRRSTIPPQIARPTGQEVVESPRILALQAALTAGQTAALDEFWAEVATHGTPLIEALDNDPAHCIATFIWRDDGKTSEVLLVANKSTDSSAYASSVFKRLDNSDVWHLSYRMRKDWRSTYLIAPIKTEMLAQPVGSYLAQMVERALSVGSPVARQDLENWARAIENAVTDPFNQTPLSYFSVASLPDAPPQTWLERLPDTPQGTVTAHQFSSQILGNERRVWVYTPPNYDPTQVYAFLVLLDGDKWIEEHPIAPILDNLITHADLPPFVAVMPEALDFMSRERELAAYPPFVEFLTQELCQWVGEQWSITPKPEQTIIAGLSLGGLTSCLAALSAPARFGNVLSQSGSLWWSNGTEFDAHREWMARQYAFSPKLPINFYVEVGLQEWVLLGATRHFRNVLTAKGYPLIYSEFNGGHDHACFRVSIAEGLLALTRLWA